VFTERRKNIQIVGKVRVVELYNKMVQNNLFIFFSHNAIFRVLGKIFSVFAMKIIYSSAFYAGKNHLTVYCLHVKIVLREKNIKSEK
jgi:hypothetical protein